MKNTAQLLLLGILLASGCGKDESIVLAERTILHVPAFGIYHACYPDFSDTEDSVNAASISNFEQLAQKNATWIYFSNNWWNGIHFPQNSCEIIRNAGRVPFIRLMARSNQAGHAEEAVYSLQHIIEGQFDADLMQWFRDAKNFGDPLLCEFGTEINGDWFPWNGRWNGGGTTNLYGSPLYDDGGERFRDAYRHIVALSQKAGANNITWFYHVNYDNSPALPWNTMSAYYPGDEYVDWIGISVYGQQEPNDPEGWTDFRTLLDAAYTNFTAISPSKPKALLEFGVCEAPASGDKAQWINDAIFNLRLGRWPQLRAVSWWNETWENDDGSISDLRINSDSAALQAYRSQISWPEFVSTPVFGH
jgi:hypothetical protein